MACKIEDIKESMIKFLSPNTKDWKAGYDILVKNGRIDDAALTTYIRTNIKVKKAEKLNAKFDKVLKGYVPKVTADNKVKDTKEAPKTASKVIDITEVESQKEQNIDTAKAGFQGYVYVKDTSGKATPEGDAKDKAMREVADGFIGELIKSSTRTSWESIGKNGKNTITDDRWTVYSKDNANVIMLAKNSPSKLKNAKKLVKYTKKVILEAHESGATFVVGDMPGVDTQFIEYLDEIGASYQVYTTNAVGKEFDRNGIDGSAYRNTLADDEKLKDNMQEISADTRLETANAEELIDMAEQKNKC